MNNKRTFNDLLAEVKSLADESKALADKVYNTWLGIEIDNQLDKITNMEIQGIDPKDYPKFVDAFLVSGELNGIELTDDEITYINENHTDIINEEIHSSQLWHR